jgi:hypothetical protein
MEDVQVFKSQMRDFSRTVNQEIQEIVKKQIQGVLIRNQIVSQAGLGGSGSSDHL